MSYLPSIPRVSKQENLESLYKSVATNANTPVDAYTGGIRSHLVTRTTNTYAWGQSKKAGAPDFIATDAINGAAMSQPFPREWVQQNFKVNQLPRVTQFTPNGLRYSSIVLKHNNTPYYG